MAIVVPDAVFLGYPHVTHLHRQEVLDDGLPHAAVIHVVGNAEHLRTGSCPDAHVIEPGLGHVAEIGGIVFIAQEVTPEFRLDGAYDGLPLSIEATEIDAVREDLADRVLDLPRRDIQSAAGHAHARIFKDVLAAVGLDDGALGLLRMIAHLRGLDDGIVTPVGVAGRSNLPAHGTLGGAPGNLRAEHEPPVVVVHAAIVEFQVASKALNRQSAHHFIRS